MLDHRIARIGVHAAALVLAAALPSACYSGLSGAAAQGSATNDGAGAEGADDADDGSDDGDEPRSRPDPLVSDMHTAIGLRRLSKFEYGNTVRDLLGVEGAESGLSDDQRVDFLSNNAHAKQLGLAELESFSRAAEDASTAALTTLALPTDCTLDAVDEACVAAFLPDFLLRAFRRPPTDAEIDRYAQLFSARTQSGDPPAEAFRLVLEAVLVSPHFLYRSELGSAGPGVAGALDSYEVAGRLSYLLWGTMPDDALFADAAADRLRDPAGLATAAERMLADPRAQIGVVRFVTEWLGADRVEVVKKAAEVLDGLPPTLQEELEEETRHFIADAMLGDEPTLHVLLTSTTTWANATVASIYGVEGVTGTEFREIELDAQTRRGLLTQPLLIAAHSKESGFSVVQMGKFVREHILCQPVPPPPDDVDTTLPDAPQGTDLTYRERLEMLTSAPKCAPCHELMNPPGFAYQAYDSIGRHMTTDLLGRSLDTSGTLRGIDGADVTFADAGEMIDVVAASGAMRACFARHYIEYAFGRTLAPEDVDLYHRLADGLDASDGDFPAFVAALVATDEFSGTGPFAP